MNEQELAELEYYRRLYATGATHDPYGPPPAAQDALSEEEQAAFWPDELDYNPKYEIARRHIRSYSGWNKQGQE